MSVRGVMLGVHFSELKVENTQNRGQVGQKAMLKVWYAGGMDRQTNKPKYCHITVTTDRDYYIKALTSILPVGRLPQGSPDIKLVVPFKNLTFDSYQGQNGIGCSGLASLDGDVGLYTGPERQQGGGGHGGQAGAYQQQPQGGFPQQPQAQGFPQQQGGFMPMQQGGPPGYQPVQQQQPAQGFPQQQLPQASPFPQQAQAPAQGFPQQSPQGFPHQPGGFVPNDPYSN